MFGQQVPPWLMQGLSQGMGGAPMASGAGMPYRNAPMSMAPVQMGAQAPIPGAPAPAQRPQAPINPAQMGMLGAMLAQRTQQPGAMAGAAQQGIGAGATGALGGPPQQGAAAQPAAGGLPGGLDPTQLSMIAQALRMGGMIPGGV